MSGSLSDWESECKVVSVWESESGTLCVLDYWCLGFSLSVTLSIWVSQCLGL